MLLRRIRHRSSAALAAIFGLFALTATHGCASKHAAVSSARDARASTDLVAAEASADRGSTADLDASASTDTARGSTRFGLYNLRAHQGTSFALMDALGITLVRDRIRWSFVEPQQGSFEWSAGDVTLIESHASARRLTSPVVRTLSGFWAVTPPLSSAEECSWLPDDLQTGYDGTYGYSASYFRFVHSAISKLRGKVDIIVIENEIDHKEFWCRSWNISEEIDGYVRLLMTAKKAIDEVDPDIRITDSGISSWTWGLLVAQDYLDRGQDDLAFRFFRDYMKNHSPEVGYVSSAADVRQKIANNKPTIDRVKHLFANRDFLPNLDLLNFHYYEPADRLPELVAFIRGLVGVDKPLMSNEMGSRQKPPGVDPQPREELAAKDMIKKLTYAVVLDIQPVIWFTRNNPNYANAGFIDEQGEIVQEMADGFAAANGSLNRRLLDHKDLSNDSLIRYSFFFSEETVDVIWSRSGEDLPTNIPNECDGYDFRGRRIEASASGGFPLFLVCPR